MAVASVAACVGTWHWVMANDCCELADQAEARIPFRHREWLIQGVPSCRTPRGFTPCDELLARLDADRRWEAMLAAKRAAGASPVEMPQE